MPAPTPCGAVYQRLRSSRLMTRFTQADAIAAARMTALNQNMTFSVIRSGVSGIRGASATDEIHESGIASGRISMPARA
jgi:hypothetical protein